MLKEAEAGKTVREICQEHGITDQTYYRWKAKYDGLEVSEARRLKQLEDENRLKHLLRISRSNELTPLGIPFVS